ncbi:MAG: hypothetical protein GX383_02990 [Clostridium sp.]|jgi:hypothetical protein|nr:hypothetical protein [Clostridium sp.]
MSIKPIDFQVMIPKTSEVSKIQKDEQNKNLVLEQQQTIVSQKKSEDNVNLVHSREETQNAKIDHEQEKKQNEKKRKNNRFKGRYGTKGEKETDEEIGTIDIRL